MSQGAFIQSFYETDSGGIHSIRIQPETIIAGTNTAPAGPATGEGSASATGGRRRIGINARKVRITWTGAPPTGYKAGGITSIPFLQQDEWAALSKGDTFSYLGAEVKVVGKTPEFIN